MCGIAASINFPLHTPIINRVMGHRGPDEQNSSVHQNVHLYHLRLSIQDVVSGQQPMQLEDRYSIIFNGEIYNHLELRQQFQLNCKTASDTETILHLYQLLGIKFLNFVDGMFAFILLDKTKKQLIAARDRAGKKPLYYYRDVQKIIFASELNCLKSILPLEIEDRNMSQFLRLGFFYKNATPYKNVEELEGGTYLIVDINTLDIQKEKWWNINTFYTTPCKDDFPTALATVENYLDLAVRRRVEASDLEVGSFLSGGIDSGLATALASKYNNKLQTFTVSFDGQYDEAPLAKLVAQKYDTKHTEINISFDNLKNDIENILFNYGEPFADSSAIPSYYVSKEAKKHLTVILNGDGADELFGGYRRYVPFSKYDFFIDSPVLRNIASISKKILPNANEKQSFYNYLYRLLDFTSKKGSEIYYSANVDIFEGFEHNLIRFKQNQGNNLLQNDFEKIANTKLSGLKKIMNLDFDFSLFGDLLVKMDIATMANSLEGRSPFLSKELLEYAPSLNDTFKIHGTTTKYLLRTLGKKYLPKELINQPKRGFEIPLKKWVENDLSDIINGYLRAQNAYVLNFIEPSFLYQLLDKKISISDEKRAKILWCMFSLEIWYHKCYNNA